MTGSGFMRRMSARLLYKWYGRAGATVRRLILNRVIGIEGGEYFSRTARRIFRDYHGVEIGMYSHGGCFQPGQFALHTKIGRYCSVARDALAFNRDHPVGFKSTHAFFFNSQLGFCSEDKVNRMPLTIGHDVWIGAGVKILAGVTEIGTGAVVGAQSVVTRNVPPYGVVTGFPARLVRFRFPREVIEHLLASRWWEQDIGDILPIIDEFTRPYEPSLPAAEQNMDCAGDSGLLGAWAQSYDRSIRSGQ